MPGADAVIRRRRTVETPDGRRIEIAQLNLKDYEIVAEEACARYKRSVIETYTRNADLVPHEQRGGILEKAFEKAEHINRDTLPMQSAWMPKRDKQGKVVLHSGERYYIDKAAQWIEDGDPVMEERKIDYPSWWMSFTVAGRVHATWLSMRKCPGQEGISLEEVETWFLDNPRFLEEVANSIGELSRPRLGNEQPAAATAGAVNQQA